MAVAGDQAVGLIFLLLTQWFALKCFNAVLLHQQPAVAVVLQRRNKGMQRVGMVRQVHLRWRKTPHPLQCLAAEQISELVLPGTDLQLQIGDRR